MYEVCMSADSRVEPDLNQRPEKWVGEPPASLGVESLIYNEETSGSVGGLLMKSGFLVLFAISIYAGYQFLKGNGSHQQLADANPAIQSSQGPAKLNSNQQQEQFDGQAKKVRQIDLTTTGSINKSPKPIAKPVPIKTQVSSNAKFHIVQPGDTLSAISRKFQIKTAEIMEINAIENPRLIKPGMKLFVSK